MKAYIRYKGEEIEFPSFKKFFWWADEKNLFYTKSTSRRIRGMVSSVTAVQKDGERLEIQKKPFTK